jgi:phosphomethylpyrimidine synthase
MNTTLSGSGWVDDIKSHPQGELRGLTKFVKITEDVRKYAAEHGVAEGEAVERGLAARAQEFSEAGAEVYSKV